VRLRIPVLALICGAILLASAVAPAPASAQGHVAVGVGFGYYRPYYYRPYFYGPWYGLGYPGYPAYYGYPYPYYGYYDLSGSLRLQVSPRETEVFIDGYFAGTVDDFDGVFQRLNVEPGDHDIELYLPGHRSVQQKLYLQPGKTAHVRLAMQPLAPGDPPPIRPEGASAPSQITPRQGGGPARRPVPTQRDPRDRAPGVPGDPTGPRDATYGSLSMRVQPGNTVVLIDGDKWEGPADDDRLVVQLSAGRHVIEVQKDGFRQYTTEVTVHSAETVTLNIALTRQ
jgi:hypothetical protein